MSCPKNKLKRTSYIYIYKPSRILSSMQKLQNHWEHPKPNCSNLGIWKLWWYAYSFQILLAIQSQSKKNNLHLAHTLKWRVGCHIATYCATETFIIFAAIIPFSPIIPWSGISGIRQWLNFLRFRAKSWGGLYILNWYRTKSWDHMLKK